MFDVVAVAGVIDHDDPPSALAAGSPHGRFGGLGPADIPMGRNASRIPMASTDRRCRPDIRHHVPIVMPLLSV